VTVGAFGIVIGTIIGIVFDATFGTAFDAMLNVAGYRIHWYHKDRLQPDTDC
tara:strand:+ start:804 stop:959 length:156 start_codon:yes stop_codon:yes gene_type:complete